MASRAEYELLLNLKAALGPNFQSTFNSASQEIRQMQNAMQDAKKTSGDLSRREAELKKAMRDSAGQTGTNTEEYRRLQSQLEATQREKQRLQQATENVRRTQEELARSTQRLEENKRALKATQRELVFTLGKIAGAGFAIYRGFVAPAAQVEQQLSNVKAGTGATAEEMEVLAKATRDAWRAGATTTEMAGIFEDMTSANMTVEQMMASYQTVLDISRATGTALGGTTTVLKNTIQQFGASTEEIGHFGDVLVALSNNGANLYLADIGATMNKVGPVASALNFSLEDTAHMIGLIAEGGVTGGQAGTALKNMLNGITGSSDAAHAAMESLRVSAIDPADGSMRDLSDIMVDLRSAFADLTPIEKQHYAQAITGQAGYAQLLGIMNMAEYQFLEMGEAIRYSSGEAERLAGIKMDNFHGQAQHARAAVDALRNSIGKELLPVFKEGVRIFTDVIARVVEFTQENPELVRTIFKVVAALAGLKVAMLVGKMVFLQFKMPVLAVKKALAGLKAAKATAALAKLTGGAGKAGGKFGKFGKILKVLGKKLLPVILIITVLGAVFGKLGQSGEESGGLMETLQGIFERIRPVLEMVMERIGELAQKLLPILADIAGKVISVLGELLSAILPVLISLVETLLPIIAELVMTVFSVFVDVLKALLPLVMDLISAILPILLDLIETLLPIIKELVMTVFAVFVEILQALLPVISQLIEAILPVLVSLIEALLPIITQLVSTVLPIFVSVLETLLPIITMLIEAVLPVLTTLLQALMPVITVLAEIFSGVLGAAIRTVTDILSGVMTVLGGIIDFITGVFTGNWTKAWEGVKNIFGGIFETIGGLIRAPINAVIGIINGAIRGINRLGISIPSWVPIIGGREFRINIPEIPMLAKGSDNSPDTFIAGEEGPELITGAKGRKVFTAAETGDIFNKLKALGVAKSPDTKNAASLLSKGGIKAAAKMKPPEVEPPTVLVEANRSRNIDLHIEHNPVIHTTGEAGDLETRLKEAFEYLVELILERIRLENEDEWRGEYA